MCAGAAGGGRLWRRWYGGHGYGEYERLDGDHGVDRLVGFYRLIGLNWLIRVHRLVGLDRLIRIHWLIGLDWLIRIHRLFGFIRFIRIHWLIGLDQLIRIHRLIRLDRFHLPGRRLLAHQGQPHPGHQQRHRAYGRRELVRL